MELIVQKATLDYEITEITTFLNTQGLDYEPCDLSMFIKEKNKIIGTVSLSNNIIKCFAIDENYRGYNIGNTLLSTLFIELRKLNIYHYFVYTKEDNINIFKSFGMNVIVTYQGITILEGGLDNINNYLINLKKQYNLSNNPKACLVMNLNPLTLGHYYLINKVSKENDEVILFLVSEDRSIFPYNNRLNILKESIKDLDNVMIIPTGEYLISSLTFPTYFIKDKINIETIYSNLDVLIFKEYFMPILNITKRYVGTEPYSPLTEIYNQTMHKYLKDKLVEIERIKINDIYVSATIVRNCIFKEDFETIKKLVPKPTYDYIINNKEALINKIRIDING